MKKLFLFCSIIFLLILSHTSFAQSGTGADYFAGKWNILLKGTPGGDRKVIVVLEKKDSTLTGVVQDSTGNEFSKISKSELRETGLTIYFRGEGYDLTLLMVKKDEDHVTGNLLAMFEAEGVRIKDNSNKLQANK